MKTAFSLLLYMVVRQMAKANGEGKWGRAGNREGEGEMIAKELPESTFLRTKFERES